MKSGETLNPLYAVAVQVLLKVPVKRELEEIGNERGQGNPEEEGHGWRGSGRWERYRMIPLETDQEWAPLSCCIRGPRGDDGTESCTEGLLGCWDALADVSRSESTRRFRLDSSLDSYPDHLGDCFTQKDPPAYALFTKSPIIPPIQGAIQGSLSSPYDGSPSPASVMAFQLYLRPYPRALYLVSSTTALVLKQPELNGADDKAEIELLSLDDVDLTRLVRINRATSVTGVLGLLSIPVGATSEIFLLVSTAAIALPPLLPGTTLTASKLLAVEFHCLTSGESRF